MYPRYNSEARSTPHQTEHQFTPPSMFTLRKARLGEFENTGLGSSMGTDHWKGGEQHAGLIKRAGLLRSAQTLQSVRCDRRPFCEE